MSFEKYRILVWKNWTIQKRHYITGIFEVILPVLFVIVFTWIRSTFRQDASSIYGYDVELNNYWRCYLFDEQLSKIAYSPKSAWVEEYMNIAFNDSLLESELELEFESFDSAQTLDDYLKSVQPRNVLGIQFDDSLTVIPRFIRFIHFKASNYIFLGFN